MTVCHLAAGVFATWQPHYAAARIPTFPVLVDSHTKRPLVTNYAKFGLRASAKIAQKFPQANAIGFMAGRRTGLTIVDVDTENEGELASALDRHGHTPIIVRSGSGHYQAWYRWSGERRLIRPDPDKPIDILGSGFVVAPPSQGTRSDYRFVQGSLDDLDHLPTLRDFGNAQPPLSPASIPVKVVSKGNRNDSLWRHCMQSAHHCDDFDALLDVARTRNAEYLPPLKDHEVVKAARSAWAYTERGENRFGHPGVNLDAKLADWLVRCDQDALILVMFLRAHNKPDRVFMVANGLAKTLGWTEKRLSAARKRLLGVFLERVRLPRQHCPAQYRWRLQGGQN